MDNSDVYVVAYSNGSCGSFITAMVERLVQPNVVRLPLRGNKCNNCHKDIVSSNYKFEMLRAQTQNTARDWWQSVEVRFPGKPMFVPTHYYSPKEMLNRFPNARSIVILHDKDDIEEIAINSFFKFIIGDHAYDTDFAAKKNFEWLRDNISFVFDSMDIKRPEDIPPSLYPAFVEIRSASVITSGFHLIDVKPEYEHCVKPIRYKDIIGNPDKVLDQLSEFTDKPMTDFVKSQYYGYVDRQKKFLEDTRKIL
jgi:hypothetical protein